MASNIFGRYIWLIDTLRRRKRLSFKEINNLWVESGLSYGEGDDLSLRTFHNHRQAIKDIFDVYIECDIKDGYKYYIDELERLEGDNFRSWLIDSYATLNQVQTDKTYTCPICRVYDLDRIPNAFGTSRPDRSGGAG